MKIFRSVALAFSLFSRLPAPKVKWEAESMRYALAALPLVGLVIGAALGGWAWVCGALALGKPLFAAGMTLLPLLVSGGIHMDGFCDTVDALSSHAAPERKREILKDPHAGAFAVVGAAAYLLAAFAFYTELPQTPRAILLACLIPACSRAAGALLSFFSVSDGTGLLHALRGAAAKRTAIIVLSAWCALLIAGLAVVSPVVGGGMALMATVCALLTLRMANRQFGGMSGDIAGFCIQVCELVLLGGLIFLLKAVPV